METLEQIKSEILKAIKEKDYDIFIDGPNNVRCRERRDGSCYLVIVDMDDAKNSNYFGQSTLDVAGHWFRCDLEYGEWSSDMEELLEDDDIIEAIEEIDGLPCGCMTDPECQADLYNMENGTDYTEFYWYGDDECPMNPEYMSELPDFKYTTYEFDGEEYHLVDDEIHDPDEQHGLRRWGYGAYGDPDDYGKFHLSILLFNDEDEVVGIEDTEEMMDNDGGIC